jgi:PKD domain
MRYIISFIYLIISINCSAQFHDNVWLFGYEYTTPPVIGNLFGTTKLVFSSGSMVMQGPIEDNSVLDITNASYSDDDGDLLAFTNGLIIKNANHEKMEGCDSLNRVIVDNGVEYRSLGFDLVVQGCLFLSYPGHPDSIILLNTGIFWDGLIGIHNRDLTATILQKTHLDDGARVVQGEISVLNDVINFGMLAAVKHANGRDWWVVIHDFRGLYYYSILIDPAGFHVSERINHDIDLKYPGAGGQAKFSQDGSKYAIYGGYSSETGSSLHLFDFDRCSGRLSNRKSAFFPPDSQLSFFGGVEFSPNNKYLYHSVLDTIYQYDLQAPDPIATQQKVKIREPLLNGTFVPYFQAQLAPDGKIYISGLNGMPYLHIIQEPDKPGIACNVQSLGIRLKTVNALSMPNHPNYRLGPLDDSACDTLGIDNLPRAWWRYEQDTLNPNHIVFRDLSFYEPTTWDWDFGDGNVSGEQHPEFTYQSPGTYQVCLTVRNFNGSSTHCKTIYGVTPTQNPTVQASIAVAPNPFSDHFDVTLSTPIASPRLRVYDLLGRLMIDEPLVLGVQTLDASTWPTGHYIWQVYNRTDGIVKSGKMVRGE